MRLIDIENIDYVRLEDSLHCLEHHKGDEVECVICAPTVEAIPKADYEARLKADMLAMLDKIKTEVKVKIIKKPWFDFTKSERDRNDAFLEVLDIINRYKAETIDKGE